MKDTKKKIDRYDSYHHSKFRLRCHVIFSTKYRRKCLDVIKDDVIDIFNEISSVSRFNIESIGIVNDHVHFIIKFSPNTSIGSIIRKMKRLSTYKIWDKHREYLSKYYCKKKKLWTNGYFCSTIGEVSEDIVKEYIENQD